MVPTEKKGIKIAAQNRKAYHDYFVEDKYEAGIELCGTEVKSIRAGTMNLKDSYCTVKDGELFVHSMHISPYEHGNIFNRDPDRDRRLLMHKREIRKLHALVKQDGYTLVPLSVYFKNAKVKVEVGLCKGKKNYDKRDATAKRDAAREMGPGHEGPQITDQKGTNEYEQSHRNHHYGGRPHYARRAVSREGSQHRQQLHLSG